jgi:anti-anti-sigma factor
MSAFPVPAQTRSAGGPDPPPSAGSGLAIDITGWRRRLELRLRGDLDADTAARLEDAMGWARRLGRQSIVIDTRGLDFVDVAGHRALEAALERADGSRDPTVVWIVGPAVARIHELVAVTRARRVKASARRSAKSPRAIGQNQT